MGEIQYDPRLGYVVQADEPDGVWGLYLIKNPKDKLVGLAEAGTWVIVEGQMTTASSTLLTIKRIDGNRY